MEKSRRHNRRRLAIILVLSLMVSITGITGNPITVAAEERINLGEAGDKGDLIIAPEHEKYNYTGKPIEPEFKVYYRGKVLEAGTDYDYMYRDNISVGTASIIIDGIGKYVDRFFATFKIVKKGGWTPTTTATPKKTPGQTTTPSSPTKTPSTTMTPATKTPITSGNPITTSTPQGSVQPGKTANPSKSPSVSASASPTASGTPKASVSPGVTVSPSGSPVSTVKPTASATPKATDSQTAKWRIGSYSKKLRLNQSSVVLHVTNQANVDSYTKRLEKKCRGHVTLKVLNTNKKATFKSNKPKIAEVNSTTGLVRALRPGECYVTARVGTHVLMCKIKVRDGYSYSKSEIKKNVKCDYKVFKNKVVKMTVENKFDFPVLVKYWLDESGSNQYIVFDAVVPAKSTVSDYAYKKAKRSKLSFLRLQVAFTNEGGPTKVNKYYDKTDKKDICEYVREECQTLDNKSLNISFSNLKLHSEGKNHDLYATVKITNKYPFDIMFLEHYQAYALFYNRKKLVATMELYYDNSLKSCNIRDYYIPRGLRATVKNVKVGGLRSSVGWNGAYTKIKIVSNPICFRHNRCRYKN